LNSTLSSPRGTGLRKRTPCVEACIELDPQFVKGYTRLGAAFMQADPLQILARPCLLGGLALTESGCLRQATESRR